jgi:predicted lipoprotein with Yx(FWY)xxD motif
MRGRWWAPAGFAAAALIVAACGSTNTSSSGGPAVSSTPSAAASSQSGSSSSVVKTTTIGGATVLTNAQGMTLYWFVPDTSAKSNCNGSCAHYWPPVKGPVTAGSGVTGKLGTITRADGSIQATYNGHPLYTYLADTAPGQNQGNGINASGGVWHEVTVTGATAPGPAQSSTSSGGGGYGY